MNSTARRFCAIATAALAVFVGIGGCGGAAPPSAGMASAGAAPRIFPDYAATTIPPNIAPIRFVIEEPGAVFRTRIHGDHGAEIVVSRPDPSVPIPVAEWGRLLESNRGGVLRFEVTVQDPRGAWRRFEEFEVRVAPERVDDYLVYRRKLPGQDWRQTSIQIRQRALGSFDESVVLDNARIGTACINCHAFAGNKTRFMSLGFRHFLYGSGTLLAVDGKIEKIPVKFGFTAWHPSGDVVVFAQQTHLSQRGSWVEDSNLCYYRRATRTVRKIPGLSREDWHQDCATFSADGRELYASAGRKPWGATPTRNVPAEILRQIVPYDLVRVRFDIQKDEWSAPETMISSQETGKNIVFPRTSPDGRWLAVRMMDARTESGGSIHLVDLERARATGRFEPKECRELSVGDARGWHSWSSNGKWIVFSSSRETGIFIRPYLAYVDAEGRVHKPVLVPAENPSALGLDAFMYNVPELIDEPVRASARALARAIRSAKFLPVDVGAAAEK